MKSLTAIVTAGVMLALGVASAGAARQTVLPEVAGHSTVRQGAPNGLKKNGAAGRRAGQLAAPTVPAQSIYVAPFAANPFRTSIYIYSPGPAPGARVESADECATSGDNCSDQQLCDIWGYGCTVAESPDISTTASLTKLDEHHIHG